MNSDLIILLPIALVLVVTIILLKTLQRRRVRARVEAFYRAARDDDTSQIQHNLDQGVSIDLQDDQGNTALHFAYYDRQEHTISRLIEFGSNENLRNREGLTAPEMASLADTEDLLERGAQCLEPTGSWRDMSTGRTVYDQLKKSSPHIYNPAIVRRVLRKSELRRRLLFLVIKLGISGSEEKLVEVLRGFGTKEIAVDYLNAGSDILRLGAERWAIQHNYRIYWTGGRSSVTWGRF